MKPYHAFWAALIVALLCGSELQAQRGRGGARGGGGFRGGGANFGGSHAGYSRSPSMSRPAASSFSHTPQTQNRGAFAGPSNRPNPTISRPSSGNAVAARPTARSGPASGSLALQSQRSYQQPSRNQLDSFLNGGGASSRATVAASTNSSPGQGTNSRTFETARGGTITVGGKAVGGTTEGGTNVGGAVGGIKIETAGGNTITKGSGAVGASDGQNSAFAAGSRSNVETASGGSASGGRGVRGATDGTNSVVRAGSGFTASDAAGNTVGSVRGATAVSDGTNTAIRGGSVTARQNADGSSAVNVRGGYADSSGYRQGGSLTAARNQWGYTAINARAAYGVGGTGRAVSKTAVRGPYGNVVSGGRGAAFVNGQFVGGTAYTAVNGNFTNWGYFGPGYYNQYPGAWFPGKWAIVGSAWAAATWPTAATYCGCDGGGMYYDYEDNVAYEDGQVLYEGIPVATEEQYYEQAGSIADSGAEPSNNDWLPLGVFAVISEADQETTDKVVQLAINKDGVIRGNLQDMLTDQVTPLTGSVDRETQRAAFKLEGNESMVVECGLYNLTNDEVPVLVHFDAGQQQPRTLIRLKNPNEEGQQPSE